MSKRKSPNFSLAKVNQLKLVTTVIGSFGVSYTSASLIEKTIRQVVKVDNNKPQGIGKVIFDNVNKLLTEEQLSIISFETLKPVLYNMIHRRVGTGKLVAHQRNDLYKQVIAHRFNKSVAVDTSNSTIEEPKSGIVKVEVVTPTNTLYNHLLSQGIPEDKVIDYIAKSFNK